jgi:cytochrome c-type biogenesis protein CcmE
MTPRQTRMTMVAGIVAGVSLATWLGFRAFEANVMLYYDPTDLAAQMPPAGERFRLGGMVEKGSVQKTAGTLDIRFLVTDFKHTIPVTFSGILPDLFREGQGVVHGRMQSGTFVADEILAKHDEKYMPPEVAESLKNNPPPPNVPAANATGGT